MAQANENIRYEPDERPPHSVAVGVGFQAAVVVSAPVVLSAVIIGRAANRGHVAGCGPDCGWGDARCPCGVGTACPSDLAAVGTTHRHRGRLRGGCPLRTVRHSARDRSALDRFSRWRVAGIGPDVQCRVLGAATGVCGRYQVIFADLLGGTWGTLLGNGMTAGCLTAIVLTAFMELTAPRRRRLEVELNVASLPKIDEFLRAFAARVGWDDPATERLCAAGEETLATLIQQAEDNAAHNGRHLILTARPAEGAVELEFLAAAAGENLEDRLAYLSEQPEIIDEREISFRLLRHYAAAVRHQKYHDLDIIAVQVERAS